MDFMEAKVAESELEKEIYSAIVDEAGCDEDEVIEIGHKLHNLLLNLTTGEANAVVRRRRGRNGWLAWKRLCTILNPKTLASGVKLISQVLNPQKIMDARSMWRLRRGRTSW